MPRNTGERRVTDQERKGEREKEEKERRIDSEVLWMEGMGNRFPILLRFRIASIDCSRGQLKLELSVALFAVELQLSCLLGFRSTVDACSLLNAIFCRKLHADYLLSVLAVRGLIFCNYRCRAYVLRNTKAIFCANPV